MSPFDQIANSIAPAYGGAQSPAYWLVVLVTIVAGSAGLLFGRRFFWIFAALLGFVFGQFVSGFIVAPLPFVDSLFELAIGVATGLLAAAAQWPVAFVMVFAGAGSVAGEVTHSLVHSSVAYWIAFVGAGALGLLAMRTYYDATLIVLSAFFSALLITFVLREFVPRLERWETSLILAALCILGAIKQYSDLRRERRMPYILPTSVGGAAPENLP